MLRREIGSACGSRSIHEISKRDVIDVVSAIEQRGAPVAANKALKSIKTFFGGAWAVPCWTGHLPTGSRFLQRSGQRPGVER